MSEIKSPMFDKIKLYYDMKLWSKKRLRDMVSLNKITKEEYEIITKESY